ncbi:MAG: D-alanine--D-alanine ligase [Actinomycetia bacterium]|nr:D-alanine--D-alanine ligase [Actinomycetes bacterium]
MVDGRIPVVFIFGGQSGEHEISCLTAAGVMGALDRDRFEPHGIGITREGEWVRYAADDIAALAPVDDVLPGVETGRPRAVLLRRGDQVVLATDRGDRLTDVTPVQVAFPLIHGPFGEDGTLQGYLEMVGLRYVGAGVAASAVGLDKHRMKVAFAAAGLRVEPYLVRPAGAPGDLARAVAEAGLTYPVYVKPASGGSSVGTSRVDAPEGLAAAFAEAARWDPRVIIEQGVVGAREIECAVLGPAEGSRTPRASRPGEILVRDPSGFYDYAAKYLDPDAAGLAAPADVPPSVEAEVRRLAVAAFEAIGAEGLSRVDSFVLPSGEVILNEINTMPGFTPISMFPRLWQQAGMTYAELISDLLDQALRRPLGLR